MLLLRMLSSVLVGLACSCYCLFRVQNSGFGCFCPHFMLELPFSLGFAYVFSVSEAVFLIKLFRLAKLSLDCVKTEHPWPDHENVV